MSFKPIPTGNKKADRIAAEHGESIARARLSTREVVESYGVSNYTARWVRVACGLSTSDPGAPNRRYQEKQKKLVDRRELQTGDGDDAKGVSYEIDAFTGEYVFTFPASRHTPPRRMPKKAVDQMVMDYSNAGGKRTRAELGVLWEMPRWMVVAILRALGIVKAGVPFTDEAVREAIENGAVNALEERWLAAAKLQVETKVERTKDRELYQDAMRWRESAMYTLEWAQAASADVAKAVREWESAQPLICVGCGSVGPCADDCSEAFGSTGVTLVLGVSDLHYGAYAWSGQAGERWDRTVCRHRLVSAIEDVFRRLPQGTRVERIVLPIGSDMAHVDNVTGATTKGTPQDMDGTPEQMVHELWQLVHLVVLSLAERAPVDLWLMEANHDHILGHALFASLAMAFHDSKRVNICRDRTAPLGPYQLGVYGQTLLGFAHGDGRHSPADLMGVMAQQGREHWSTTRHRIWLTGHRHVHSVREEHGVEVHVLPSLSGTDRYHQKNWPHRQDPRLKALVLDDEDGLVCSIFGKPRV